jgi:hypothetical protein
MKKKTWKKSKAQIIIDIGPCKHCGKDMVNTESFVIFADKSKAHYICYKNDHEKGSEKPQN